MMPFPISDIDEILPGLLERRERVFYTMGLNPEFDQRVIGWLNALRAQARSGLHRRRRSSWRSITCCTTCGCLRAAPRSG